MRAILIVAIFVFSIFGAQLLRVQALDAGAVQEAALQKRLTRVTLPALRGQILDANGALLATSIEQRTVTVDQTAVPEYIRRVDGVRVKVGVVGAAQALAPLLGTTADELVPQLMGTSRYRIIAKDVTPLAWRDIAALGIPGVYSERTTKRVYPTGISAAPVVGFVQQDGTPGAGVEVMMASTLAGTPGEAIYERARDGTAIPWAQQEDTEPVNGQDVTTTIDADLQWYAENAIAAKVIQSKAQSGYVVVMEAKTGKLRAVASYPTIDPADLESATASSLQNGAFVDVYEPGSTGKVMSVAAAIEEGAVTPTTDVIVPNRLKRSDKTFKDHDEHDTLNLTLAGVLAKSSNIGTILSTESLSAATMDTYYQRFGIGAPTGVGFPGESPGLLTPAADINATQRYTMLFGQGYSVNAIQAAGVFQTIANGGVRVPPSLVESTTDPAGNVTRAPQPQGVRVVSESTAKQVSDMLEEVVGPGGTAPQAAIAGYRVAGKTGTAQRYNDDVGGYSGVTASFIGYAPADDPEYVVAVTLQDPTSGRFGGQLGGPVFKDVMTYALQSRQIAPSGEPAPTYPLTSDRVLQPGEPGVIYNQRGDG